MPMRTILALTVIWLSAPWLARGNNAQTKFEPCDVFEFEGWRAPKGRPMQAGKMTFFTSAELPWTPIGGIPLGRMPNPLTDMQGFAAVREDADINFHGKTLQGKLITWKRDPKQPTNVPAAVIRFWVSHDVPTPGFPVEFENRPQFRVPPGCVKFEIVAHKKGAEGIDADEIEESVAVSGEYHQPTTYKVGDRSLQAHLFKYAMPTGRNKGNWTLTLSRDVPGGICSMTRTNDNDEGGIRLLAITAAPLPKNIEAFPDAGFGFAPPDGYSRMNEPPNGECVRFKGADNAFIAIKLIELRTPGLEALRIRVEEPPAGGDPPVKLISISPGHHIAGSPSFDAPDVKTGVLYIFTERAGRGYRIEISGLGQMEPDKVQSILHGWRWSAKP